MSSTGALRLIAATFGLSALAFAASIAGDLALGDPEPGGSSTVVLRLPPAPAASALAAEPAPDADPALEEAADGDVEETPNDAGLAG